MRRFLPGFLGFILAGSALWAQELGPTHGSLVIVGGAMEDKAIMQRFVELAGGPDAPMVIIPTAGEEDNYDRYYPGVRPWQELGVRNITVLHTRDRNVASSAEFVAPLQKARAVWFPGGRQWRLADAYLDTRTELELRAVLDRGGVIGGSSAGATILGSFLVRGDTRNNTVMVGDHVRGFGLLKHSAIDQHLLTRNRHFDLIPVIEAHPDLLGIGIDEDTAIVVQGDSFEVMGRSVVAIYDHKRTLSDGGRFYFLRPGDTYDMKERQARRRAFSEEPFDVVKDEPWPDRN